MVIAVSEFPALLSCGSVSHWQRLPSGHERPQQTFRKTLLAQDSTIENLIENLSGVNVTSALSPLLRKCRFFCVGRV
jgi:hypothetical protein